MTTTVVSQSNADSIVNLAIINTTNDSATAAAATLAVGFVPRRIEVINMTDLLFDEWLEGMAAGAALHTVGSTGAVTATSASITNNGDGTITLGAAINLASKSFIIVCQG